MKEREREDEREDEGEKRKEKKKKRKRHVRRETRQEKRRGRKERERATEREKEREEKREKRKHPCVYAQNASVCTVRTSPCVPATGPQESRVVFSRDQRYLVLISSEPHPSRTKSGPCQACCGRALEHERPFLRPLYRLVSLYLPRVPPHVRFFLEDLAGQVAKCRRFPFAVEVQSWSTELGFDTNPVRADIPTKPTQLKMGLRRI